MTIKITNSANRYGWLSMLFHWSIAVGFIAQFYLIYRRPYFPEDSPERLQYILLHKSLGITLLFAGILYILWHFVTPKPPYAAKVKPWETQAAHITHGLLYLLMLIMPISGYMISMAAGIATSWFGYVELPMLIGKNDHIRGVAKAIHEYGSFTLIGLAAIHTLAALKHHFINHDNTLRRMLPMKLRDSNN